MVAAFPSLSAVTSAILRSILTSFPKLPSRMISSFSFLGVLGRNAATEYRNSRSAYPEEACMRAKGEDWLQDLQDSPSEV
jgi:hypothetical protein